MKLITTASFLVLAALAACKSGPDYGRPLPLGAPALLPLGPGDKRPDFGPQWSARDEIYPALENSIAWTKKKSSANFFPIEGVTLESQARSLERFKQLLIESKSAEEFDRRVADEFTVYKSAGWDGKGGGVLFTGYCTPILDGRKAPDAQFKYPLFAMPSDLVKGPEGEILGQQTTSGVEPYPTRHIIEATGMLEGKHLELAYLKDPIDAYIAHVNGSAFIKLENGDLYKLGYAGKNGRPYVSLGQELVKADELPKDGVSLRSIRAWAKAHPDKVETFLDKNDSYVFFTPIDGNPHGSLNVPVTSNRSIATDKRLFPRASIVYVQQRPGTNAPGGAELDHFLLDQDTGGAIRTAGRADVYLGIGPEAESRAGTTRAEGQLYYLFLKDSAPRP
jgi:membrane-bound lytic murein transglycosylase A